MRIIIHEPEKKTEIEVSNNDLGVLRVFNELIHDTVMDIVKELLNERHNNKNQERKGEDSVSKMAGGRIW